MILKTAYYVSNTGVHSVLAAEANFLSYTLTHQFNQPATATIILADPTGSMAQKYDVDTNAVYVGAGRAYIEDPDNTCVFDGRIVKARHDTVNGRVILLALDWMHQLTDERNHYDMREDLDGSGLRRSEVHTDIDGDKYPVETNAGNYYLNDDDMSWAIDEFNGKYLAFTNEMAGKITVGTGPYDEIVTASGAPMSTDDPANGEENVWDDDTSFHHMVEVNDDWAVVYYFRVYVNQGSLYVANSISGARIHMVYTMGHTVNNVETEVQVCTNFAAPTYTSIAQLTRTDLTVVTKQSFEIPEQYLSSILHTDGTARVRFDIDFSAGTTSTFKLYYLWLEVDVETTDYASTVSITDTLRGRADGDADYHTLQVGTDLSTANLGIWEGCEYSIIKPVYNHVEDLVPSPIDGAVQDNGGAFTTETTAAQNITADDMTLLEAPVLNDDAYYFGFTDATSAAMLLNIGTAGVGNWAFTWEYSQGGAAWANLAGFTDGTDEFRNSGMCLVEWTIPGDWAEETVNGVTLYWVRASLTTLVAFTTMPTGTQAWKGAQLFPFTTKTIEATTAYSTKHYTERSKLEILTDLAKTDKTVFWVTLGGTVFNWKKTFNDGSPTEITDASVLAWSGGEYDFSPMRNEYHIYGIRIEDEQLFVNTEDISGGDPGSTSKTKYGVTKSEMLSSAGTTSEYEATSLGSAIVSKDMLVHLYLQASIHGLSTLRLGSEVNINSTLLGLTDKKYVITHWSFNSETYRTIIRLHPRSSIGYIDHIMFGEHIRQLADKTKEQELNAYSANLTTQVWT